MKRSIKRLSVFMSAIALVLCMSMASVFAAAAGVDWGTATITVTGTGVAPATARTAAQARMLAKRAAVVDAYRQLAEEVQGVQVDSESTVANMMVVSDVTKTKVSALVKGAQIVSEQYLPDGAYEVTMSIPMFGVGSSLAGAVMERPAAVETFPAPVASVPAAAPSVRVDVTVAPGTTPAVPQGSSAASAPAGQAIGNFTGVIVDCRGLGLNPVMSPVIKNANGQPIYGYKNLNYDKVIANGMADYATDMSMAARAGRNPLIVKAVRLDNHNGNPVLSVADANRVLIENGATGFLDNTNVVFLR